MSLKEIYEKYLNLQIEIETLKCEAFAAFKAELQELANTGYTIEFTWDEDCYGNYVFEQKVYPDNFEIRLEAIRKYKLLESLMPGTREFIFKPKP